MKRSDNGIGQATGLDPTEPRTSTRNPGAEQPRSGANRRLPCRRHRQPRCRSCGLHEALCVCAVLPRVLLPFEVWLVQHAVEVDRPTNTGRILHAMIPGSRIWPYGLHRRPFDPTPFQDPSVDIILLFPDESAPILTPADLRSLSGGRRVVVLLDGTWTQASHLRRKIPALRKAPCAQLPPGPPGRWRIRCATEPGRLCTLEAGVRLVRLAGLREEAARMDTAQDLIMARMLYMKGRRPSLPPIPPEL